MLSDDASGVQASAHRWRWRCVGEVGRRPDCDLGGEICQGQGLLITELGR